MFKKYIKRKIGYLTCKSRRLHTGRFNKFSFFDDLKRKEILVFMWQHGDKDKDQIKEIIIDKFNISDLDAENLFNEAFPEGLSLQEDKTLTNLDKILERTVNMNTKVIDDVFDVSTGEKEEQVLNYNNIDQSVVNNIQIVVASILKNKGII